MSMKTQGKRIRSGIALGACLAAAGVLGWVGMGWRAAERGMGLGQVAPEFSLPEGTVTGPTGTPRTRSLEELRGSWVLLHFWASWCEPCLTELPSLLRFAKRWEDRGFRLFTVSLDRTWEDSARVIPPGEELRPRTWISTWDEKGGVADLLGSYQYPETYLLSRDLRVMMKWVGPQEWGGAAVEELAQRLTEAGEKGLEATASGAR